MDRSEDLKIDGRANPGAVMLVDRRKDDIATKL